MRLPSMSRITTSLMLTSSCFKSWIRLFTSLFSIQRRRQWCNSKERITASVNQNNRFYMNTCGCCDDDDKLKDKQINFRICTLQREYSNFFVWKRNGDFVVTAFFTHLNNFFRSFRRKEVSFVHWSMQSSLSQKWFKIKQKKSHTQSRSRKMRSLQIRERL